MKIPDKYKEYYVYLEKGQKETLRDSQTRLYIKAKENVWVVKVDRGIIADINQRIRKCDYLIYGEISEKTHLVELKGSIIDEAYIQLNRTIDNIAGDVEISYLINGRKTVDAFIVSPNNQKIPRGINSHERELVKRLASRCRKRPENIYDLLHYIKVVPKQAKLVNKGRQMISSGQAPVEMD